MPNYLYDDLREEFLRYVNDNQELKRAIIISRFTAVKRKADIKIPTDKTFYKWYNESRNKWH